METSSIATYEYAVGSLEEIKSGTCERKVLRGRYPDFAQFLRSSSRIIVPMVVGIFQKNILKVRGNGDGQIFGPSDEEFNEALNAHMQREGSIQDLIISGLIHVGYDAAMPVKPMKEFFNDRLGRVAYSPANKMPIFSAKDAKGIHDLLNECSAEIKSRVNENQYEIASMMREKYVPRVAELSEKVKPFGLTRFEWYGLRTLNSFPE